MTKGTLEVVGTIDTAQFWPTGTSDADTANIFVNLAGGAFRFSPHAGAPFTVTHFAQGATVVGKQRKPPVNDKGKLTIRLQGIDAPELHYRPAPLSAKEKSGSSGAAKAAFKNLNHSYRQFLGATAAKALHDLARQAGAGTIPCRVFTFVDTPNEVFDTYGRFVGDVEITVHGNKVNINRWLAENGWAFPAFYVSMNNDEINAFTALGAAAKKAKKGIWKFYNRAIGAFDFRLLEPKKGDTSVLPTDKGPVMFPKLYRRQTNWVARNKAKIFNGKLLQYLQAQPDKCYETADWLENHSSATQQAFADFVSATSADFDPADLVFAEATSKIIGSDGKPIMHF